MKNINTYSKIKKTPSNIICFRYSFITLIIIFILFYIIPVVLNYGPDTINTAFDMQMSYITYNFQFAILTIIIISSITIITKLLLRDIDDWYKNPDKYTTPERLNKIRKKCFNLPYIFFIIELVIPFIAWVIVLSFTGSHESIMITKIIMLLSSFALFHSVASFIFAKDLYDEILSKTYIEGVDIDFKISLKKRIFLLILPTFFASILFTSFIGYSCNIYEQEKILFNIYSSSLNNAFDKSKDYDLSSITTILENIEPYNSSDTKFILTPDNKVISLSGKEPSNFSIEYTKQLSESYGGKIYDSYGVDTQGYSIKLTTSSGIYYVGILYNVFSESTLLYLFINFIFLFIVIIVILYIFANSLSKNLSQISDSFESVYDNAEDYTKLPIISNDEIGKLVLAFNKIQKINSENVLKIKNNQDMFVERERLASLGQMIGGIAHNLKTPIFSISGAIEGITDLIDEYESSIGDPSVTTEDINEISKEMHEWTNKIKIHLSYMSDLITAVKGQAVTLSADTIFPFSISEVFNQVNILMKHELKNALVTLNTQNNVSDDIQINGNINSLVQVLNNLITNAIEEYNGEPNQNIDLEADLFGNNVIISIKDYAKGLSDEIKEKLFKEMITTKGKDGTGIGLFLSYSTIKANFKGNITFDTSEKGTVFYITLPIIT